MLMMMKTDDIYPASDRDLDSRRLARSVGGERPSFGDASPLSLASSSAALSLSR
jgi:hypothetical protein